MPDREPAWRQELAHRLAAYRARRQNPPDGAQTSLPFASGAAAAATVLPASAAAHGLVPRLSRPLRPRPRTNIDIAVVQRSLDFSAAEETTAPASAGRYPVAPLRERLRAGLLDAVFLLLAYAGFLLLFGALGGQFSRGRFDVLVYGATLLLFYAQYFGLFTALGGATPGMRLRGLALVSFDGTAPPFRQLVWRSFGYLVSGGAVLLGFLWALWDDQHLTWQDRVSQTYITPAAYIEDFTR